MAESEHSLEKSKGQMGDRVPHVEVAKKGEQSSQELPTTSANKKGKQPQSKNQKLICTTG